MVSNCNLKELKLVCRDVSKKYTSAGLDVKFIVEYIGRGGMPYRHRCYKIEMYKDGDYLKSFYFDSSDEWQHVEDYLSNQF